jgi:hypothetical protein
MQIDRSEAQMQTVQKNPFAGSPAVGSGSLRVAVFMLLLIVGAWAVAAVALPLVPEDGLAAAGPALGLLRHGRFVDPLVFSEFRSYMSWPPLYLLWEATWFLAFGVGLESLLALMVVNIALVGTGLLWLGWRHCRAPARLSIVLLLLLSSNYWFTGRPDSLATAFVALSVIAAERLLERPAYSRSLLTGVCLGFTALAHPLAGWSAAVGVLTLTICSQRWRLLPHLALAGGASICVFAGIYGGLMLSDVSLWKGQVWDRLVLGQNHFSITAPARFWFLNFPFVILFLWLGARAARGQWRRLAGLPTLFAAIGCSVALLPMGMSYYYTYTTPFWAVALLDTWALGDLPRKSPVPSETRLARWRWTVALIGIALWSLAKGPGVPIGQVLRRPEYRSTLLEARRVLRETTGAQDRVFADVPLVVAVIDRPRTRMWLHSFLNHPRRDIVPGAVIAVSNETEWEEHRSLLGDWRDRRQYTILTHIKPVRGLPRVYRSGAGPSLGLILVRKRGVAMEARGG